MCVEIHMSVSSMADQFWNELRRKYYITPKSYLDCVNFYITLFFEKREESVAAQDRFLNGLNKLKETNELIATMKVGLVYLILILSQTSTLTKKTSFKPRDTRLFTTLLIEYRNQSFSSLQ
jgi:dynein heavy chain